MIEGVDSTALGELDLGADRDKREILCAKHPWCFLRVGHVDVCARTPRREMPSNDFGPNRRKR